VVTEVLSIEYSITGILNVLEWVAKKHCIA